MQETAEHPRVGDQGRRDVVPAAPVDDLLGIAIAAAHQAGHELLRRWGTVSGLDAKSSPTDVVSDADRAAERIISTAVASRRPDDAQVGEEGTARVGRSAVTWTFDPLDGTVNYLYGRNSWCVSIAASDHAGALVGVVYEPVHRHTTWAVRDGGAWRDGTPIAVSDVTDLGRTLVATGFSYQSETRSRQADVLRSLLPRVRDIRRSGCAALDLCDLASGRHDAYAESPINSWDIEAAALIAREAGAVTLVDRLDDHGRSVVAASPGVIRAFARALADAAPATFGYATQTEPELP
ncbi:MAG TPA: inositol monophosphatase family protein [Jiangellaceae bacterium]